MTKNNYHFSLSSMAKMQFLVVEDDALTRMGLEALLAPKGAVFLAETALHGRTMLLNFPVDIAFIDLDLEYPGAGFELIGTAVRRGSYPVVLSGHEDQAHIAEAYRRGCADYLAKPFSERALESLLKKFRNRHHHQFAQFAPLAFHGRPVLILGETGTGKGHLARQIHRHLFEGRPFVELSCAEIPEDLLESELFGHEKGAFSGAVAAKPGRLELAHNGVLFLDEVATMPGPTQSKLLKAIEEKRFYRLGATRPTESQFFLISATCEDLKGLVRRGTFRQDLYFRLEGHLMEIRPLRERREEVSSLIHSFLRQGERRVAFTEQAMERLLDYPWPGNIRELANAIELLRSDHKGIIDVDALPSKFREGAKEEGKEEAKEEGKKEVKRQIEFASRHGLKKLTEKIEREVVDHFLKKNRSHVRKTIGQLQISSNIFYKIIRRPL